MKHDSALIDSQRAHDAPRAHPQGHDRVVAVLPAAFAVSGGTYQRLVPRRSPSWRDGASTRPRDD